jgi:hypothetical protein
MKQKENFEEKLNEIEANALFKEKGRMKKQYKE